MSGFQVGEPPEQRIVLPVCDLRGIKHVIQVVVVLDLAPQALDFPSHIGRHHAERVFEIQSAVKISCRVTPATCDPEKALVGCVRAMHETGGELLKVRSFDVHSDEEPEDTVMLPAELARGLR